MLLSGAFRTSSDQMEGEGARAKPGGGFLNGLSVLIM